MSQIFRLFEPNHLNQNDLVKIEGDSHHILSKVLRMEENDEIQILNGRGQVGKAVIQEMRSKGSSVKIVEIVQHQKISPTIRLYVGSLKGEKLATVIQKCVELGIDHLAILSSDHSVAIKSDSFLKKCEKTAIEAMRQSGNPFLPGMEIIEDIEKIVLDQKSDHWNLVLDETEENNTLAKWMTKERPKHISLFIGPEGSFSTRERKWFEQNRCDFVRIAPYVLRSETAAISAVASCRAAFL